MNPAADFSPDAGQRARLQQQLQQEWAGMEVLISPAEMTPFECDALAAFRQMPLVVVLPETELQVQQVLRTCLRLGVPVVPRGAGTGLAGSALPMAGGVLLVMSKFKRILAVDAAARTAVVQPGVRNLAISEAAAPFGLYYAPDPSSKIACSFGGNLN